MQVMQVVVGGFFGVFFGEFFGGGQFVMMGDYIDGDFDQIVCFLFLVFQYVVFELEQCGQVENDQFQQGQVDQQLYVC